MSYVAEEFEVNGNKVAIIADEDAERPDLAMDQLGTITYKKGARTVLGYESLETEEMEAIFNNTREYIALPVYAYIHSSIALNTTGFSCPWDSGQSGIIYVSRQKIREEFGVKLISPKLKAKVEDILRGEVETFSMYLEGDVWGYVVTDPEGEEIESCWGFYGMEYCKEEATAIAESHQEAISA